MIDLVGKFVKIINEDNMEWAYRNGTVVAEVKTQRKWKLPGQQKQYNREYIVQFNRPMAWCSFRREEVEILKGNKK